MWWPVGGRNLARKVVRSCVRCTRLRPTTVTPIMGNLPKERLDPGFPFLRCGADYAGPMFTLNRKVGRPLTAPVTAEVHDVPAHCLTRYQRLEQIRQHFWKRWSQEYVSELQTRSKWQQNKGALKEDMLVLIKDDHLPPMKWKTHNNTTFGVVWCIIRDATLSEVRAVHLELVSDLTKEAFLAAFSRFISRRGKPQRVYSDNGSTFVGAFNELSRFIQVSSKQIESDLANQDIQFKFIPAYSPHFGGIWEAAVKSTKHLLRRVLSLTHLTYEELSTCLIQIEAILNSRPLTPLSSDPSDLSFLTPSHFLLGRAQSSIIRPGLTEHNIHRLQRFDRIEKLRQHFWQRYSNEYVSLLQQRTRWQTGGQDLKVGAMVLVRDVNLPPLLWLLGRVVAVKPGTDGRSRVADIRTKKGTITRAYNNIVPLPLQ
ncbi:uncharacterized protein LOC121736229 [Aricia agestis]|uniref:uncharacterized protein LOC121736229 n=1 Tax=Aricia agestis TaxID=91739 RepID=UPI001C20C253|nr:uncharacterized protein LOC121736229 [Aricia agestis]